MNNNTNNKKKTRRTYKVPETTILEHLMAKAERGDKDARIFLDKVLDIRVV